MPSLSIARFCLKYAPFFDLPGFCRVKPGCVFRFTGFLQGQARPPFSIYMVFTESIQAPFFDLQGFYRIQARPPFSIYSVFTGSSQAPFFDLQCFYRVKPGPLFRFTGFLQSQARPPFSIYRVFTESSQAHFFDLQCFYRVKPRYFYMLFTRSCKQYLQVIYKEDTVNICNIFYSIYLHVPQLISAKTNV